MLSALSLNGQSIYKKQNYSLSAAIVLNFGSTLNRIGIKLNSDYRYQRTNIKNAIAYHYNLTSYGHRFSSSEWKIDAHVHIGIGEHLPLESFLYTELDNTGRKYAIGYGYHYYKDNRSTSQSSGTVNFRINKFIAISENDILGNLKGLDQFRTGTFLAGWIDGPRIYSMKTVLWTGQTRCDGLKKVYDSDYPARYGYKDITSCRYGRKSHGILAAELLYKVNDYNLASASLGIDSEQVRHVIQNKFIHDMYFLPRQIVKSKNLHLPMYDNRSELYLYHLDQMIRKSTFFYNFSLNNGFYY
jgi:hypothetical protein